MVLAGTGQVVAHPFLGILPMRDDPRLGVEIRYVYPKSPAANAGLMAGDRIIKYGVAKKLQAFHRAQTCARAVYGVPEHAVAWQ